MTTDAERDLPRDPQDLERFLIERQWAGDIDGMVALYEPDAVLDDGEGRLVKGKEAIRALFDAFAESGKKFAAGTQSPAVISGDLALTSTHLPDGSVTAEVARRQADGTWLWVIDRYSIA